MSFLSSRDQPKQVRSNRRLPSRGVSTIRTPGFPPSSGGYVGPGLARARLFEASLHAPIVGRNAAVPVVDNFTAEPGIDGAHTPRRTGSQPAPGIVELIGRPVERGFAAYPTYCSDPVRDPNPVLRAVRGSCPWRDRGWDDQSHESARTRSGGLAERIFPG